MRGMEEYAIVLDYLPHGKVTDPRRKPLAQVVGEKYFTLLEVYVRPNVTLQPFQRIFVGKGERKEVEMIRARIRYDELTSLARGNLEKAVETIVEKRKDEFVSFYNKAPPITVRMHSLELIPGIGKKYMYRILEEREKKPFESFEEIKERIPVIPDPKKCIVKRIIEEIKGETKYYLFAKPPGRR